MPDRGGDYEDRFEDPLDDGAMPPLLPPDDRLWRHPSEIVRDGSPGTRSEEVRQAWVGAAPSRAGVWTAGLVGAVLATGLVLVGSHLTAALTARGAARGRPVVTTLATQPTLPAHLAPGPRMSTMIAQVSRAMVLVTVTGPQGRRADEGVGIVATRGGTILTTERVVAGGTRFSVRLSNGRRLRASLLGSNAATDVAVLRVSSSGLDPARFDTGDYLAPGVLTFLVLRTPTGVSQPAAAVVTAVDQRIAPASGPAMIDTVEASTESERSGSDDDLGGVLLDNRGAVVGIVADSDSTGTVALPCWLAWPVAKELASSGRVVHGWLGITGETIGGATTPVGVRILAVDRGGAAWRAGLRAGEVIVGLNGSPIESMPRLQARLYLLRPGTRVSVELEGRRPHATVGVVLGSSPS